MATKIELECALLKANHEYKWADNNANAFCFKANFSEGTAREENQRLEAYYRGLRVAARTTILNLEYEIARLA